MQRSVFYRSRILFYITVGVYWVVKHGFALCLIEDKWHSLGQQRVLRASNKTAERIPWNVRRKDSEGKQRIWQANSGSGRNSMTHCWSHTFVSWHHNVISYCQYCDLIKCYWEESCFICPQSTSFSQSATYQNLSFLYSKGCASQNRKAASPPVHSLLKTTRLL